MADIDLKPTTTTTTTTIDRGDGGSATNSHTIITANGVYVLHCVCARCLSVGAQVFRFVSFRVGCDCMCAHLHNGKHRFVVLSNRVRVWWWECERAHLICMCVCVRAHRIVSNIIVYTRYNTHECGSKDASTTAATAFFPYDNQFGWWTSDHTITSYTSASHSFLCVFYTFLLLSWKCSEHKHMHSAQCTVHTYSHPSRCVSDVLCCAVHEFRLVSF